MFLVVYVLGYLDVVIVDELLQGLKKVGVPYKFIQLQLTTSYYIVLHTP
jgi:hypothetical protein